ncbi:High mobility group HMG box domain containing protein [Hondaea fermentalgiana]|uniref:High mobility group HMG box domain containing protein n=1 Tax=Hondaea fermentalgiana TaxID=2315210 RepID=A0A2R5G9W5_9STRA|nr:High mobility group HMG box domain containing protein [Hondaea fermentalgiana]|eukprot:GBG27355.1 High mobility group HMG box domain containing protein [Hondaea fermentalgiana]
MDDARNRMVPFIKQHIPDVLLKDITRVAAAIWREDVHEEEKQRYVQLYDNLKAKFMQDSKTFKERKEQAYAQAHAQAHAQQPLPAPTSHYMMDMHSPMKDVHPHAAAFGVPVVDEEEEEGDSDDDQKGRKKRGKHKKKPFMQ